MVARSMLLLGLAIAIAAIAAGCGGGSDDASGDASAAGSPPLSKAEFVKLANAGCEEARAGLAERISAYLERNRTEGIPHDVLYANLAHFVLLATIEAEMFGFVELTPPAGEEPKIGTMLSGDEFAIDKVATTKRIPSIAAAYQPFTEVRKQFRAYGMSSCADGLEPPMI